jgi:hypothetical protein
MKTTRFIYSARHSACCESRALLVRSRAHGFVARNCLRCGKSSDYVSPHDLPNLECEFCATSLKTEIRDDKNYFYCCAKCGRSWRLADWLPDWSELFEYCGLYAPGDDERLRRELRENEDPR